MLITVDSKFVPFKHRLEYFVKNKIEDFDLRRVSVENIYYYLKWVDYRIKLNKCIDQFDSVALPLLLKSLKLIDRPYPEEEVNDFIKKIEDLLERNDKGYEKCLCSDELGGRDE